MRAIMPNPLPDSFLFGVATSDHQGEAFDPATPDIWDEWERKTKRTPRGRGTDFWNRFEQDVKLAAGLGCKVFRFSISWARVEPVLGHYDEAAFEHYRAVIRAIRAAGMEPLITLCHWVYPLHLEARGGLVAPGFPQIFAAYARAVAERLGQECRFWLSFNEPNVMLQGYFKPWNAFETSLPPGLGNDDSIDRQVALIGRLIPNFFRAHTLARAELQTVNPAARVSANPLLTGLPTYVQWLLDWRVSSTHDLEHLRRIQKLMSPNPVRHPGGTPRRREAKGWRRFVTILRLVLTGANSNWWHLGMAGKLPAFLCPPECVGQHDFVGLDHYWAVNNWQPWKIADLLKVATGRFDLAPVYPESLHRNLKKLSNMFPDQDIFIIENGSVRNGVLDPGEYIRRHVLEVQRAVQTGSKVIGYLCWSITSNSEWGLKFAPENDFGLYFVDLENDPALERRRTATADAYQTIIRDHGVI
jgi:beta-glucosidase/6-phospho-beta-glucosidase/beta-galactosidase